MGDDNSSIDVDLATLYVKLERRANKAAVGLSSIVMDLLVY